MQIRISKAVGIELAKPLALFGIHVNRWRYCTSQEVNISEYTLEELRELQDVLASSKHRTATLAHRDIDIWVEAMQRPKRMQGTKARKFSQVPAFLKQYICHNCPNLQVYTVCGDTGAVLPYVVTDVQYFQPRQGDGPAYVQLEAYYRIFGKVREENWCFYWGDCAGATPHAMLQRKGLYTETPALRELHGLALDKADSLWPRVGLQVLGVGPADSNHVPNSKDSDRYGRGGEYLLDGHGKPARLVVDAWVEGVVREMQPEERRLPSLREEMVAALLPPPTVEVDYHDPDDPVEVLDVVKEGEEGPGLDGTGYTPPEIPTHPFLVCFDLLRHERVRVHAHNVTPYVYDDTMHAKLVLPPDHLALVRTLISTSGNQFADITPGKGGGTIVVCQGGPGTGKTLTAEVFAEAMHRPLYSVQCSQLGTKPSELEKELTLVLQRGKRWGAVMLLDEADVYVQARGADMQRNAIVGVFLRVLEYQAGVLFLTTNRGDQVDDAILSRCVAKLNYAYPTLAAARQIWRVLGQQNGLQFTEGFLEAVVAVPPDGWGQTGGGLSTDSGRDIKNILKLAMAMAASSGQPVTPALVQTCRQWKPA